MITSTLNETTCEGHSWRISVMKVCDEMENYWTTFSDWGILLTGAIGVVYLYWKLFHQPFDLFRDFTELGFDEALKFGSDTAKRNAINQMRHRRKIGKLPPPYPNGWYAILESRQLKHEEVKEVYAVGQNLVAWRGLSGSVYVADAYCPHIGAHLGVGGEVSGECIKCPFHSWTFDGGENGKVKYIPYAEKLPEFVRLQMWKAFETNGFIYLWHHASNEEPTWYPDEIAEINNGTWCYRGRTEMRVACHVQEIPENGADVAHLNVLHSDLVLCGDNPKNAWFSWSFIKHVWEAKWEANATDPNRKHEALLKVKHHLLLFGWIPVVHIDVDVRQTGPGIVNLYFNTALGKGVWVQTVTPQEPLLQNVVHHFYSSSWIIHPLAKIILDGESKQIARDIRIWNRKCFLDKPVLTKEDQSIKAYRRWFAQFYSENPPNDGSMNDNNANRLEF